MDDPLLVDDPRDLDDSWEPHDRVLQDARRLVLRFGRNATSYQILNPGLSLWFSPDSEGVVGYVETKGCRVVAGEPIGEESRVLALADAFEQEAAEAGRQVCYFGAEEPLAGAPGTNHLLLGAQPSWRPQGWVDVLTRKASLRAQLARSRNKGIRVERWPVERATNNLQLTRCLAEWLQTRGLPPMHFLVEPETLARLFDRLVFVALHGERAVGFLVASPAPLRRGWLIEQIIRGTEAPNGTSETLIDAAMRHLAEEGAHYVTLGLSPLSRRSGLADPIERWWIRWLLGWVRAHGRRFYDFDGLDFFKAKLEPDAWEPIYALTRGRRIGLRDLYAIASAFSGTTPWTFLARGSYRALRTEIKTLGRWLKD